MVYYVRGEKMFVDFTKQEQEQADAIEDKYEKAFKAIDEIVNSRTDEPPEFSRYIEYPEKPTKAEFERIEKENDAIRAANKKAYREWEAAGSPEWLAARVRWGELNQALNSERTELFRKAEARQFKALGNDPNNIFEDAKKQVKQAVQSRYKYYKDLEKQRSWFSSIHVCALEDGTWLLDEEELRLTINGTLRLHIEVLKQHDGFIAKLNRFIDKTLKGNKYVAPPGHPGKFKRIEPIKAVIQEAMVNTIYPASFVTPTDKVSSLAFNNDLTGTQIQQLAMERRGSKKRITTLASIDFDKLNGAVQIKSRKELTAYDREVHDAIITLFVDGGNEYITPQMIYQVMTGNPDAYLNPKQAEAISESITKCMYSRLIIDASEEAKAYGFDSFKYDGSLISGERVTATLNGTVAECLRLLRKPVLYEYAEKKSQIGRFDIKLLNSPINKTEEIITLQGYLYRRILSMKGSSNLSKTIVYDTVYNQIEITAASDGALRKKKSKVRNQIKTILDYWKKENFIAGYVENKRGTTIYSVTIRI